MLRFTTAGSVDDGKSTLIGRLLHDSKSVYEDQLASVKNSRINRSSGPIDFSLLTDGLRAEREQGITIDVAYRYFTTPRRKFIIADTPGHEQYTRNMATGASTAELAVVLIDGTKGLLPQTRRHSYIASLLGIPNVLAAINKMDLVDYREDVFLRLQRDFIELARQLGFDNVACIPISALNGDNVIGRSNNTPWYQDPSFLEHLETVPLRPAVTMDAVRFPIQYVIRPDARFRGFAGQVASGVLRAGDPVVALPSGQKTRVHSIVTYDGDLPEAVHPMSVTVRLKDEIDLSRGDMLVSPDALPHVSRHFEAMVVWLHQTPLEIGRTYLIKHTAKSARAKAMQIKYRVDINSLAHEDATELLVNDIAAIEFESTSALYFDPYARNRTTGSFILIDPISNATVGAGMIQRDLSKRPHGVHQHGVALKTVTQAPVSESERYERHGHYPGLILVEGSSALANRLERELFERGFEVLFLGSSQYSLNDLTKFLPVSNSAGLIVIYSTDSVSSEAKRHLAALASDRFFDLSAMNLPANDEEGVQRVLSLIQGLQIGSEGPGKLN